MVSSLIESAGGSSHPSFNGGGVTKFQGKTREYKIETHLLKFCNKTGCADTSEDPRLFAAVKRVYAEVYPTRDQEKSQLRLDKTMSLPRTIVTLILYGNEPVGFGLFPRVNVQGGLGGQPESVIWSSRAIKPEHQDEYVGTHIVDEAIKLHQEIIMKARRPAIRYLAFMTHNPASIASFEKLQKMGILGEMTPFNARYNLRPEETRIMLGVYGIFRMNSVNLNMITGVSKGELKEVGINENFRPDPKYKRPWEIYQEIISPSPEGLDMNREAGDEVWTVCRILKPGVNSQEPALK